MGQPCNCLVATSVILFLALFDHVTDAFILLAPPGPEIGINTNFTLWDVDDGGHADDAFQLWVRLEKTRKLPVFKDNEILALAHDTQLPVNQHVHEDLRTRSKKKQNYDDGHIENINKTTKLFNNVHVKRFQDISEFDNRRMRSHWNRLDSSSGVEGRAGDDGTRMDSLMEYGDNMAPYETRPQEEQVKMPRPPLTPGRHPSLPRQGHRTRVKRTKRRARASVIVRAPSARSRSSRQRYPQAFINTNNRQSRVDARVGVLVVADYSVYRQYMEANGNNHRLAVARIRRYYGMVFAMMNERFQTIQNRYLSISVAISGILIAERSSDSPWTEDIVNWASKRSHGRASVDTGTSLRGFSTWLDGRRGLPEFDHAMVFTAYRLTDPHGVGLGGMAYLEAVCDTKSGNAVSIVGDKGDFQSVRVATHELAHSLGATHDGEKGAELCPSKDAFIMSSMTSHNQHAPLRNAFYFSQCSIRDMSKHLSKPRSACVKDNPAVYYDYDLKRFPPGRIYSADLQCKLIFGSKSKFCGEGNLAGVMCGQLWCRDPTRDNGCRTNSYLTALPGTRCGRNGMCSQGDCILDKSRYYQTNDNNNDNNNDINISRSSSSGTSSSNSDGSSRTRPNSSTIHSTSRNRDLSTSSSRSRSSDRNYRSRSSTSSPSSSDSTRSNSNSRSRSHESNGLNTSKSSSHRSSSRGRSSTITRGTSSVQRSSSDNNSNVDPRTSIRRAQSRGRSNVIPSNHRVVRPSYRMRKPRRNRRHRSRSRGRSGSRRSGKRQKKNRRRKNKKNRCKEDKNESYCRGLIELNPGGCRRRAIRHYCCVTCRKLKRANRARRKQKTQ